jgi:hypothetical protein
MKATVSNGLLTYRGPSAIDGLPIQSIMTGIHKPSKNPKTGPMIQQYIITVDIRPSEAVKTGADVSICGSCVHRPLNATVNGEIPCYITTWQAPNRIFDTEYPTADSLAGVRDASVRLGAYGEPTALPFELNARYIEGRKHTGYTHRWRETDQRYKNLLMASVDSPQEQAEASKAGWRTFRVRKSTDALLPGEIACPASKESGRRTTCDKCLLCNGTTTKAKNIAIIEHGSGRK